MSMSTPRSLPESGDPIPSDIVRLLFLMSVSYARSQCPSKSSSSGRLCPARLGAPSALADDILNSDIQMSVLSELLLLENHETHRKCLSPRTSTIHA